MGGLFAALLDSLDAKRAVVISGPAYWWHPARSPAFTALPTQAFPLIRGGQVEGRIVIVGYHPTYARRKRVGAEAYGARITEAVRSIEAS